MVSQRPIPKTKLVPVSSIACQKILYATIICQKKRLQLLRWEIRSVTTFSKHLQELHHPEHRFLKFLNRRQGDHDVRRHGLPSTQRDMDLVILGIGLLSGSGLVLLLAGTIFPWGSGCVD